jgi:hypothetical protein
MFVRLAKLARLELKLQAIYVSSLKGLIMGHIQQMGEAYFLLIFEPGLR